MAAETVTGEVKRVTYESEESGFRVIKVAVVGRGVLTAVGKFLFVAAGTQVRMTGEFASDSKHGPQFRVHTLVPVEPTTLAGIEKYLGSGLVSGIGPGFAARIVEAFGLDTLKILDSAPDRLSEVVGLGTARRESIASAWADQRATGNLMMLLQTHGIAGHLARAIIERYGDRAAEVIQTSPYRLASEVRGIGFRTADTVAASLGIARDHPDRVQAGILHALARARDSGHLYLPKADAVEASTSLLNVDPVHVVVAIDALWAQERLVVEEDAVFLTTSHHAELNLTTHITRLLSFPAIRLPGVADAVALFEKQASLTLAPQQRDAIEATANHSLVIITGGPGVGKTTIVRAVLSVLEGAKLTVALAAPTGRAAKRLTESTQKQATTLHRLLEFDPKKRRFLRDEKNPLEAQAVVVDEASMVDVFLAESLVAALPERARLIMVGDVDQLPSVGPGAVLRDLIQSGSAQVVVLDQVFRQVERSMIVRNAHRILNGEEPVGGVKNEAEADFFVVQRSVQETTAETIVELVARRIPKRFGLDAKKDIQVLCPMHRGPTGTEGLNEQLQQVLNAEGPQLTRGGHVLRQGDRVMQLRNDYERDVYNGDLGTVSSVDVEKGELSVDFDGKRVAYAGAELDALTLAYATSIHKSQGSEYPAVVVPFLMSHFVMLSRNLLYTAVTRARQVCVLVADPKAVRLALSELKKEQRYSRLRERLQAAL